MKYIQSNQVGQALVTLLVFMVMAIAITSAAVVVTITTIQGTTTTSLSAESYAIAQSGVENAILQLLRNPNYAGETLAIGTGTATITVTGTTTKTITSQATVGNLKRTIQVIGGLANNTFTSTSWQEID